MTDQNFSSDRQQTITIQNEVAARFAELKLGIKPVVTTEGYQFATPLTTEQVLNGYADSQTKREYQAINQLRLARLRLKKNSKRNA